MPTTAQFEQLQNFLAQFGAEIDSLEQSLINQTKMEKAVKAAQVAAEEAQMQANDAYSAAEETLGHLIRAAADVQVEFEISQASKFPERADQNQ